MKFLKIKLIYFIIIIKKDLLKDFFIRVSRNDPDYFNICLKNMLKEDVALLQKYIKFKFN